MISVLLVLVLLPYGFLFNSKITGPDHAATRTEQAEPDHAATRTEQAEPDHAATRTEQAEPPAPNP